VIRMRRAYKTVTMDGRLADLLDELKPHGTQSKFIELCLIKTLANELQENAKKAQNAETIESIGKCLARLKEVVQDLATETDESKRLRMLVLGHE